MGGEYARHSRDLVHRKSLKSRYYVFHQYPLNTDKINATQARNEQIAALIRGDLSLTLQDVADVVGITRERVRQICQEHGVVRHEQLREVRHDGTRRGERDCSRCHAQFRIGAFSEHARSEHHRLGKLANPRREAKTERNQRLVELYVAGVKIEEILSIMIEEGFSPKGLHYEMIYRLLPRYGYRANRGGGRYFRDADWRLQRRTTNADLACEEYVHTATPMREILDRHYHGNLSGYSSLYRALNLRGITFRRNPGNSDRQRAYMLRKLAEKAENAPEPA